MTYSKASFWTVKVLMLFFALIVIWNLAKESGREEIRQNKAFQVLTNGTPVCVWGNTFYPATQLDTKRMQVKIKR